VIKIHGTFLTIQGKAGIGRRIRSPESPKRREGSGALEEEIGV